MRKGTCKFFTGSHHNTHCEAGVEYKSVLTEPERLEGSAYRYPCHQDWSWCKYPLSETQQREFEKRGTCQKYTEPSAEEITKYDAEVKAHIENFTKVLPLVGRIKTEHKGKSWKGIEVCPVCAGKLHLTHAAYNGHVWGTCETKDCVRWME